MKRVFCLILVAMIMVLLATACVAAPPIEALLQEPAVAQVVRRPAEEKLPGLKKDMETGRAALTGISQEFPGKWAEFVAFRGQLASLEQKLSLLQEKNVPYEAVASFQTELSKTRAERSRLAASLEELKNQAKALSQTSGALRVIANSLYTNDPGVRKELTSLRWEARTLTEEAVKLASEVEELYWTAVRVERTLDKVQDAILKFTRQTLSTY